MPIEKGKYDLTGQEFRDALAVRYRKPLLCVPPRCDGCGVPSSLDHFLICRKGPALKKFGIERSFISA